MRQPEGLTLEWGPERIENQERISAMFQQSTSRILTAAGVLTLGIVTDGLRPDGRHTAEQCP